MPSLYQTGVQDFETFNKQLESLGSWLIDAEEALRAQDPNGCTELTVIQDRMEELKVFIVCFLLDKTASGQIVKIQHMFSLHFSEAHAEI